MTRTRPARVLFLPLLFYPEPWNGIMEHLRLLAGGLPREWYSPLLATRASDGLQTSALAERACLPVLRLSDRMGLAALAGAIRREGVALVHVHTPVTAGVPRAVLAARLGGSRVIVSYHQVQPRRIRGRSRAVNRAAQRLAAATLAVSGGVADTLTENAGLAREGIEVIHNGVEAYSDERDVRPRFPDDERVDLAYFGRLAEEKDVGTLIRATALAREQGLPIRTMIVGEGYERAALERLAEELGASEAVRFLGFREDARAIMRQVDIVVHPPQFEGFGLTLIEAMEAAVPIVATRVAGGITELVRDGENGLLVPPSSPRELAAAIRRLVEDPGMRTRLGERGRALFQERFRSEVMVRRVLDVYERVLR